MSLNTQIIHTNIMYEILIADNVVSFMDKLDKNEKERIIKRLELLKSNPKSVGEPRGKFWILKVGRSGYRLAFRVIEEENIVRVTAIEKRKSDKYYEFYR